MLALPLILIALAQAPAHASPDAALAQRLEQTPPGHEQEALRAAQAAFEKGVHGEGSAYEAACLAAKSGQKELAFTWLQRALKDGFDQAEWMAKDPDLASLRGDARFASSEKAAAANHEQRIASEPATDRPLQRELLAMEKADQDARQKALETRFQDKQVLAQVQAVDRKNTARMKQILDAHGWPGTSLVGPSASQAAWLLVQHADLEPAFQEQALGFLEKAVKAHQADGQNLAYLTDRVRVAQHRPQVYGTQFVNRGGKWVAPPIEDPEHVDARRAAIGLEPLAVYQARLKQRIAPPPPMPGQPLK